MDELQDAINEREDNMKKLLLTLFAAFVISVNTPLGTDVAYGQGMPPARVVVANLSEGMIAPQSTFVGTAYFNEVSDVAAEVDGKVEEYHFNEGQRIGGGDLLVVLNSDMLQKALQAARANLEEALSNLEQAENDFARTQNLYADRLVSTQKFDDDRYRVKSLQKKATAIRSDLERMEIEIKKKRIYAPFSGIVLKRHIDRGEWVNRGSSVATIAKNDDVYVRTEVPADVVRNLVEGMTIELFAAKERFTGKVTAIIPRGDIRTRTFPVKIRVGKAESLMEGMQVDVTLPVGPEQKSFTVSRDAVIKSFGMDVIYIVKDAKAVMIPVRVIGYSGMNAGLEAEGLARGMKVVVKGNERLRNGQAVQIIK
jgi:RND family efflux transporter MFP subunit